MDNNRNTGLVCNCMWCKLLRDYRAYYSPSPERNVIEHLLEDRCKSEKNIRQLIREEIDIMSRELGHGFHIDVREDKEE